MSELDDFNGAGVEALEFSKRLFDAGHSPADIAAAMITVGVSMADAGHGKAEAIQILRELADDLRKEAN